MKKSLSVLVAGAMVSSMFASVAFAATAELDTQGKYDALKALGIFEGTENGAELDKGMTREQLAKIIAKIKEFDTPAVTATSYSDVAADRWSAPFIEAVSKAKPFIMDGTAPNIFNPAGNVTVEQLATVMVRALGLQVKSDAAVKGNVSEWAKGFVAAAVEAKILPEKSDFTADADRATLVEATYAAKQAIDQTKVPAKVSVTEAKATGVKTVQVTLNKEVDTAVAKLALKKGSIDVATDVKFGDDKKSATLTLKDTKLTAGTYTVTLSGIDAANIDKASAEFTAEDEKVTKLDFVNASDTLAKTTKAIVKIKASNQYGENASFSAGSYTVYAGNNNDVYVKLTKSDSGELLLTLDTTKSGYTEGLSIIPVNIYHNDTRITASKNFKLGTAPFISKMELGTVKYSNGKDSLNGTGEAATFDVINYDQYGNIVPYDQTRDQANTRVVFNSYEPSLTWSVSDSNSDDIADVKISLTRNVDKAGDYTFTVYNQAGSATSKVSVKSAKVATKIEIGELTNVIAAGDDVAYIPVVAYDANGQQLSVDDLVSSENVARINISGSTGTGNASLVTAGEHKGKIKLTNIPQTPRSIVSVTAFIATPNASSTATKTYTVSDVRVPEKINVVTEPAKKIVPGASSAFKFVVLDQYGKELKTLKNVNVGDGSVTTGTGSNVSQYRVTVTTSTYGDVYAWDNKAVLSNGVYSGAKFAASKTYTGSQVGDEFNQDHKFVADATATGNAEVVAVVEKTVNGTWTEIAKVSRKIEAISATEDLTYSVNAVAALYNAKDSDNWSVTDSVYASGETLTYADQTNPLVSKFAREVTLTALDAAGNKVAIPAKIKSVTSSNPLVAVAAVNGAGKAYVIGNKKGTATLNVAFETNKGETLVKTVNVETKDDVITSKTLVAGNTARTMAQARATTNAFALMNVKVTDNYGVVYEGAVAQKYNYLFGVVFSVKNVVGGTVTVDQYGNLTIGSGVTSFELVATSATGLSASTAVAN